MERKTTKTKLAFVVTERFPFLFTVVLSTHAETAYFPSQYSLHGIETNKYEAN